MPTAIVAGATGMLGRGIVLELGKDPQWSKIFALSRGKKEEYPTHVVHSFIDLQASCEEMAKELAGVEGEYLFFAAYLQKDTEEENWDVNGDMLQNFLSALEATGAAKRLKRVILVTGCKQYGVHLGPVKLPMHETDPWLRDSKWPPNFYYRQQDILASFCNKNPHVSWVVTYPNDVIGFAKGNFMNLATSLGVYVAVCKELGQNEIAFPGSPAFYLGFDSFTSADLHAEFCAWAAFEPRAANQAFNVVNGDVESWQHMFPLLAKRYGLHVKPDQFAGEAGSEGSVATIFDTAPLSAYAESAGLVGSELVVPGKLEQRIDIVKWSKREDVKNAWTKLADRDGLLHEAFEKATWEFLAFELGRSFSCVISMSKARAMGWTGYKDTWTAFSETFDELEREKMLPKSG